MSDEWDKLAREAGLCVSARNDPLRYIQKLERGNRNLSTQNKKLRELARGSYERWHPFEAESREWKARCDKLIEAMIATGRKPTE